LTPIKSHETKVVFENRTLYVLLKGGGKTVPVLPAVVDQLTISHTRHAVLVSGGVVELLIFVLLISLPYLVGWAFLAFVPGWRSLTAATIIWFILLRLITVAEGHPDGGPIGGVFAIIPLFWTGLFAGAVSSALSILSGRAPTAQVRPILSVSDAPLRSIFSTLPGSRSMS
jgi:hypothetical protein